MRKSNVAWRERSSWQTTEGARELKWQLRDGPWHRTRPRASPPPSESSPWLLVHRVGPPSHRSAPGTRGRGNSTVVTPVAQKAREVGGQQRVTRARSECRGVFRCDWPAGTRQNPPESAPPCVAGPGAFLTGESITRFSLCMVFRLAVHFDQKATQRRRLATAQRFKGRRRTLPQAGVAEACHRVTSPASSPNRWPPAAIRGGCGRDGGGRAASQRQGLGARARVVRGLSWQIWMGAVSWAPSVLRASFPGVADGPQRHCPQLPFTRWCGTRCRSGS